jgi:hypothetical protein
VDVHCSVSVFPDVKKIKRRLYQQKRRQSQGKEPTASGGTPKKQRIRKVSVSIVISYSCICPFFFLVLGLFVSNSCRKVPVGFVMFVKLLNRFLLNLFFIMLLHEISVQQVSPICKHLDFV